MKRMACVIALATGTGVVLGATASPALAEKTSALASGLQLAIASPSTVNGDSTISLDVEFRGGNVRSVELYVDGTLIKKQVIRTRDSRGLISFALDGLTEGDHEVLIKAFDQDGNPATATSRLKITPPDVMDTLVKWQYPKKEEEVRDVVPIQIAVDRSIRNPYVTFLIDNEFLAFINLPPFTYNWDTSRLSNGSHTIGVEVYDGESLARVKTLTMKVHVNNPGGKTILQKDTPDLTKKPDKPGPLSGVLAAAQSALPKGEVALSSQKAKLFRVGDTMLAVPGNRVAGTQARTNAKRSALPAMPNSLHILRPGTGGHRVVPSPLTPDAAQALRNTSPNGAEQTAFANPVPPTGEKRVVVVPGLPPLCVQPKDVATLLTSDRKVSDLARVALRPRRAGNIAAMPTSQLGGHGITTSQAPVQAVGTKRAVAVKATVMAGDLNTRSRSFAVAFDNQRIVFDVAPRVEKGLPLAPFRQIFEHTGGKVEWYKQSQTVRAINAEREIEFRVGKKDAKVNNQSLEMEAKPYLERGRTIVPLSFVRDAMNVKVHYDAATGRMVIESNK